jgi:hypothetical protein
MRRKYVTLFTRAVGRGPVLQPVTTWKSRGLDESGARDWRPSTRRSVPGRVTPPTSIEMRGNTRDYLVYGAPQIRTNPTSMQQKR